jgi:phage major head subunit gpT-like protein
MQITSATLRAINKQFKALYDEAYQGGPALVPNFAMRTTATTAEGVYGWLAAVPSMREWIGDAVIQNLKTHDYSIPNKEFELTVGVDRVDIERDQLGVYTPMLSSIGASARQHPDQLLADRLLGGFANKAYTGKNFFDANHEPVKGGTKFSNAGTKKLSAANFQTARENIKSRRNSAGRPMNLGKDLVLIVSPKYEATGRAILVADLVNGGDTNVNKGTARLEVWPLLSASEDSWFLLDVGQVIKPFIHQVEKETVFTSLDDPNSAEVMLKKRFIHQAYGRYNVGFGLPELAYGSTGADAA